VREQNRACSLYWLGLLLLVCLGGAIADAHSQLPKAQIGGLELRIDPEGVENGIPQAFKIVLVNNTNHDVRLPMPSLGCSDTYSGNVRLVVHFTPLWPDPSEPTHTGCAQTRAKWPPIMDRIKGWTTVHAGSDLNLLGTVSKRYLNDQMPGAYEVWASYSPPFVDPYDEKKLRDAGIGFPHDALSSPHSKFNVKAAGN
jgi:hypothetical protein